MISIMPSFPDTSRRSLVSRRVIGSRGGATGSDLVVCAAKYLDDPANRHATAAPTRHSSLVYSFCLGRVSAEQQRIEAEGKAFARCEEQCPPSPVKAATAQASSAHRRNAELKPPSVAFAVRFETCGFPARKHNESWT